MKNKDKHFANTIVQDVFDVLGGKWRGMILASLCDREKRFNELKRDLGRITPKTLTKELKFLEENKLLIRNEIDANNVLYELTTHGHSLSPLIAQIVKWGMKHRKEVLGS